MKLSIAWIFEHLKADWKHCDIAELVKKFNSMTAEIEGFEKLERDIDNFILVKKIRFL